MSVKLVEYGCGRCGTHVEVPDTGPLPKKCIDCGSMLLVRKILGPNQLKKQILVFSEEITKMWEELDRFNKTLGAMLDAMKKASTDIIKQGEKLDAFIRAHDDEEPYDEQTH